jgi:hypothetical protein
MAGVTGLQRIFTPPGKLIPPLVHVYPEVHVCPNVLFVFSTGYMKLMNVCYFCNFIKFNVIR